MYTHYDLDSKNDAAKVNGKTRQKKQELDATESELGNTDIQVEQLKVMRNEAVRRYNGVFGQEDGSRN